MSYEIHGQVLCGPFSNKCLPSYQAAMTHYYAQWQWALNRNMQNIIQRIINSTVRFNDRHAYIRYDQFITGQEPNIETGFAGQAPIAYMSEKTFYSALKELQTLGIVIKRGLRYTIDYSIHAVTLAASSVVQRRVLHENKRGGLLSTIEGITAWATKLMNQLTSTLQKKQPSNISESTERSEPETPPSLIDSPPKSKSTPAVPHSGLTPKVACTIQTQGNKGGQDLPYTLQYNNYHLFPNKLGNNMGRAIRGIVMGTRSASDILSGINESVDEARARLADKRRFRRTLSDECNLFEQAWMRGQRSRDNSLPPSRIAGKASRALLKKQIVTPSRDTSLDLEKFAYWVTENWDAIGANYFAKSKGYPATPAFRWLVACFETYVTAWTQREYLDATASLNKTEIMQRAAGFERANEQTLEVAENAQTRIKALEAELKTANTRLSDALVTGRVEPDDFEKEMQSISRKVNKAKPKAVDESEWADQPKRKRLPQHRR